MPQTRPDSRRWARVAFLLLLTAITAACTAKTDRSEPAGVTISIIGTNDFHGALLPASGHGGLPVFAGFVKNLREKRASDGDAVLLIDAGDMWQGTLESNLNEGLSVLRAYEALQYDAVTIGNHEFDYGPAGPLATPESDADDPQGALRARAAEASFPFLSANLIDKETGRPVDWSNVSPSIMIEKSGVSIGIIGGITEYALATTIVANVRGLQIAPLLSTIQHEATRLRQDGADIVVVTTHAGAGCTSFNDPYNLSSCSLNAEIFRLATALPAGLVDVIVAGHSHKGIAHIVNGISVISSFSRGTAFGRVDLVFDRKNSRITDKTVYAPQEICEFESTISNGCDGSSVRASYAGQLVSSDPYVEAIVMRAVDDVRQFKERELGVLVDSDFTKASSPEYALGNLLADIMLETSDGADIAIHNTLGGIRAGIAAGPLTFGDIYEMFPFDNLLVQLTMDGATLKRVFEAQLQGGHWRAGMSGLHLVAECQGPNLNIVLTRMDGRVIQDHDTLIVATTDFLATGGDAIFTPVMPEGGFQFSSQSPRYRDEIVSWMEHRGGVLRQSDFHDPANARFTFPGETPVSCAVAPESGHK